MKINEVIHIRVGGFLLMFMLPVSLSPAAVVKLPGSMDRWLSYLKSFSAAENNIIYYLNETLLFEQMPSLEKIEAMVLKNVKPSRRRHIFNQRAVHLAYKNALKTTLTYRIERILSSHREMKEHLVRICGDPFKPVSLDLNQPQGNLAAKLLLEQMGIILQGDASHGYRVLESCSPPDYEVNHYYQLLGFNPWSLEKQLNRTGRFDLEISEFQVSIPWDFDFLHQVTDLELGPDSFAECLSRDKRLSLLLGLLYRLSAAEIDYISGLGPNFAAWKKIYRDPRFLCGMFVLSHGLRVKNQRLVFPGSPAPNVALFWEKAVGVDYLLHPLEFLQQLATKDHGKLNYFYIFTFFLPEDTQKAVLFSLDFQKFQEIFHRVELEKQERIRGLELPGLRDFGFFTLIYALRTRDGGIRFPGGSDAWAKAVGAADNSDFGIIKHLLETSKKHHSLKRFIPVYGKFFFRPEILTEEVIRALYENYLDYNVVVDFIEKIPIKKPQTVLKLFAWAKSLENLHGSDQEREALTALFQSLLEILARRAKTQSAPLPYDGLIEELMQIPLSGAEAYDGVFRFLADRLGIPLTPTEADQGFGEFLFPAQPDFMIRRQAYRLEVPAILQEEAARILESQSAAALSHLVKVNRLLESLGKSAPDSKSKQRGRQLLPPGKPGVPSPVQLGNLLAGYPDEKLFGRLNRLRAKKLANAPQTEIDALIEKIKAGSLLYELKHTLLTYLYAVTLKRSKLQVFLNPDFTRLHDFSSTQGKTPWNHSAVSPQLGRQVGYHLEGGLSRLEVTLAFPFSEYLFGREIGFDSVQGVPIIYNHLDLFPYTSIHRAQEYAGLLIRRAEELVEKSRENPAVREALQDELMTLTSGYRYRTITEQLTNPQANEKAASPLFYFSELLRLGGVAPPADDGPIGPFYIVRSLNCSPLAFDLKAFFLCLFFQDLSKKRNLTWEFSQRDRLEAFQKPGLRKTVQEEMNRLGSIYYHTFGTLKPYRYHLFPQPLALLFASRWTGAEMIDELKVKTAYISYLQQMPPQLLGCVMYRFLVSNSDLFFCGSIIDYHRTYFLYSIFNYLVLNRIYNDFRKEGILRIK